MDLLGAQTLPIMAVIIRSDDCWWDDGVSHFLLGTKHRKYQSKDPKNRRKKDCLADNGGSVQRTSKNFREVRDKEGVVVVLDSTARESVLTTPEDHPTTIKQVLHHRPCNHRIYQEGPANLFGQ